MFTLWKQECQDGKRGGYKRDDRRGSHSYPGGNQQNRCGHHRQDGQKQRHCTYCDLTNHTVNFCNTKNHEMTDRERAELAKKRKIGEGNVAADLCTPDIPLTDQDFSLMSTSRYETRSTGDWFADSGATQHMTDQREALENYVAVPEGSWSVTGIGSTNYNVKGYGNVKVWIIVNGLMKLAVIKKVLYVPELGTNLFSTSAATRLGWEAIFSGPTVIMVGERA